MQAMTDGTLLELYEAGSHLPIPRRALAFLAAAYPEETPAALGQLTPGRRDARLLAVRQATFGPEMQSVIACPACGAALEFGLAVADLLPLAGPIQTTGTVQHAGYSVCFRLPTSLDLAEIVDSTQPTAGPDAARQQLLKRCLLSAEHDGQAVVPTALSEPVLNEVVQQMAALDPQANLSLDLTCAACDHTWQAPFDVVAFLWDEVRQRAREVLQEVHLLARAYGWREDDVLALSPRRRRAYLELAYE